MIPIQAAKRPGNRNLQQGGAVGKQGKEESDMINRASGILCHITSLPSPFGIEDFGPAAYAFADFLAETKQSYWQGLPMNPTNAAKGQSTRMTRNCSTSTWAARCRER